MKKFAVFALCFVFAFLCIGCGDNQNRGLADGANQETIEVLEPEPDSESETPGQSASEPKEEESAAPEDEDQSEAPPENSDEDEVQDPEQEEENDSAQPEIDGETPAESEDHEQNPGESDENQNEPEVLDSVAQLQNQILQTFGIEIDLSGVESAAEVSASETSYFASLFLQESFESFAAKFALQFKYGGKLFENTTKFEEMAGFYLTAEVKTLVGTVAITLMISGATSCSLTISK